jgi:hypothetical protein
MIVRDQDAYPLPQERSGRAHKLVTGPLALKPILPAATEPVEAKYSSSGLMFSLCQGSRVELGIFVPEGQQDSARGPSTLAPSA